MNPSNHEPFWKTGSAAGSNAEEEARRRAELAPDPEALARFEEELALTRLLHQMPDKPVPSNFTSRILRLAELESRENQRSPLAILRSWWTLPRAAGGLAFGSLLLGIGLLTWQQQQAAERRELAQSLMHVSRALKPALGMLGDMKAIEGYQQASLASSDINLVDALQ